MARAFVSAGSNIEPEKNIREAVRRLKAEVHVHAISTVYHTEPIGNPAQPAYYNCVIEIETDIPPVELKHKILRAIEKDLGRVRTADKFASRTIDLDLILYDEIVRTDADLTLPDPDILGRHFLAAALYELEPDLVLPGSAIPVAEAAKKLRSGALKPLAAYTDILREELRNGRQPGERAEPDS